MRWYAALVSLLVLNCWDDSIMGDPFRDGRVRIFIWAVAPFLAWVMRPQVGWLLASLWLWAVAVWAYWGMDGYGWQWITYPPLFVLGTRAMVRHGEDMMWKALRVSYWIQACLGVLQWAKIWGDFWPGTHWRPDGALGTIGQETLLGSFLAPLVAVAFFRWSPEEALLGALVCVLCDSSMTMGALGVAAVVALWKRIGIRAAAGLSGVGISCLGLYWALWRVDNSFFNTSGRTPVWETALNFFPEHAWIGWGPGAWAGLYTHWDIPKVLGEWLQLHCEPLDIVFATGWPGLAMAVTWTALTLLKTRNADKAALIAGLVANSLGNATFHYPVTGFLMAFAIALPEPHENA